MWSYNLENFGYIAWAFGQRQVLLSLLGFALLLTVTWSWRHKAQQSLLGAWLFFWLWMLPFSLFGSSNPDIGVFSPTLYMVRETLQSWIPQQALSPCAVPYVDRMSGELPLLPNLSWHQLLPGLWLLIAASKAAKLLRQRMRLTVIAKNASPVAAAYVRELAETWQQCYALSRAVSVRSSSACQQAFTIGVLRPVIFLPEQMLGELNIADIDAVLGHEFAHIKRGDDFFVCFQLVTKCLLFFNPLIWLSARRITSLRERCCDRLAMQVGKLTPQNYANSLLRVAELQRHAIFDSEAAAGLTSSALAERVNDVLITHEKRSSYLPLCIAAMGLLMLNIVLMPNPAVTDAIDGSEAKALFDSIGAVPPMSQLKGDGGFSDRVGNACGLPDLQHRHYHPGADFVASAAGDHAVRAIVDGEVTTVSRFAPYLGIIMQIRHADDVVSTYAHLSTSRVQVGDHVQAGQPIGAIGENHLHLEVRANARVVDPSVLLAR